MSKTSFVLFGLVLFSTSVSSESYLTKCCPPGQIFLYFSTTCVSVPWNAMELYVHHWNTTVELFQGTPQCDEPEDFIITPLDDFDPNNFLKVPACLEILYNEFYGESTVIVIHCRSHKGRQMKTINASFPQLAYIRKCCPRDTVFDSRIKSCVSWLNETESFVTLLLNESADADLVVVKAAEGPPTCKGPIVDYEIDENDIFLRNRTYSVMVPANNNIVKEELSVTEDNACLEMTSDSVSNRTLIARVCRDPEYCDRNACIQKCCAENEFLYIHHSNHSFKCNKLALPNKITEFHEAFANYVNQTQSDFDMTKDYGVLIGMPCKNGINDPQKWLLTSEGYVKFHYRVYDQSMYCMDTFNDKLELNHKIHLYICFKSGVDIRQYSSWFIPKYPVLEKQDKTNKIPIRFWINTALHIISCAFLLITLLMYLCLPSLQNLHGKTLMGYMSSLLLAFTCLSIITWINPGNATEKRSTTTCKAFAYTALFSFISTFSWLNVMCFDIWWTFGVSRGSTSMNAREQRKRFLLYCLYVWGLSFLISILAIIADSTDILPDYLQPEIDRNCWFTGYRSLNWSGSCHKRWTNQKLSISCPDIGFLSLAFPTCRR